MKDHPFLPYCYFPTTILAIDDNINYLTTFKLNLNSNHLILKLLNDPEKALKLIKTFPAFSPSLQHFCKDINFDETDYASPFNHIIDVSIFHIHQTIYSPYRFNPISTVLVDHHMPSLTGIEFFKLIEKDELKKILVTGVGDEKLAVQAFNQGIIHRFIPKGAHNFYEEIKQAIDEVQLNYFVEQSMGLMKIIINETVSTALKDNGYVDFFKQFLKRFPYTEFYLLDQMGSYLFLNANGELKWLIVKSATQLEELCQIAKENNGSSEVIHQLQTKCAFPFLFTQEAYAAPVSDWANYMYPLSPLKGDKEIYYYTMIDGNVHHFINTNQILSFNQFFLRERYMQEPLFF